MRLYWRAPGISTWATIIIFSLGLGAQPADTMSKFDDMPLTPGSSTVISDGRASAMMVFSLLRPGGLLVQRLVLWIGRRRRRSAKLSELSLIHFARLAVIRRFPDHGQAPDELLQPLQLFESNYNGTFDGYIDSFVDSVPWDMRAFWATSYGFPWRLRRAEFERYIQANEFAKGAIDHYYVAYPEATVRMIGSARRVVEMNAQFRERALGLGPQEFAAHYRAFLTEVQADL